MTSLTWATGRAKELFEGRKTCNLSHARATATRESQHQVFDIDNLQQTQLQQFHKACGEIFRTGLLSTMAVPEVIFPTTRSHI